MLDMNCLRTGVEFASKSFPLWSLLAGLGVSQIIVSALMAISLTRAGFAVLFLKDTS